MHLTHWSIAQTKHRETEPSGIGWELFKNFLIARDKYDPEYFLYENNKSMSDAIRAQITEELGVEPIMINSALVSAQSRQRLYWTNIPGVELPEDRGILLRDILETGMCWREKGYTLRASIGEHGGPSCVLKTVKEPGKFAFNGVAEPVQIDTIESAAKNADFDSQQYRVYSPDGKSVTLCGQGGGVGAKTGLYAVPSPPIEYRPLDSCNVVVSDQNIRCAYKDGSGTAQGYTVYFDDVKGPSVIAGHAHKMKVIEKIPTMRVPEATKQGYCEIAPGECVDLSMEHSKTRRGRRMAEKSNCLTTSCALYEYCGTLDKPVYRVEDGHIVINGERYPIKLRDGCYIIRKLTVRECMRLQTVPEDYVFPVSDAQAYKMLGNGWTVDVIAHIFSYCPGITEEPVEVLSMYDGMSCGHLALDKLGAIVARYYATEIDKYAIRTTQHNYPYTIQLGDAFQVREDGWSLDIPAKERGETVKCENIPAELKQEKAWVNVWNSSKVPMQTAICKAASSSLPKTWAEFDLAAQAVENGEYDGIGYVFHDTGLVGIDIDVGFDDGFLTSLACDIIDHCKSYTEKSRSGRGVHILLKGKLPFKGRNNRAGVEIYQSGRYFIMTGDVLLYSKIVEDQAAIDYILETYFPDALRNPTGRSLVQKVYTPLYRKPENGKIKLRPDYPAIGPGARNMSLTSLAGQLHNHGYDKANIYKELLYANSVACTPPLDRYEVEQIVSSVTKYRR